MDKKTISEELLLTKKEKRMLKGLPKDSRDLAEFNILESKLNAYLKKHNLEEL